MNHYDVFVYGTLRKRGTNHRWLEDALCIHNYYIIQGYSLYNYQGWYPYMIEGQPNDQVVGEVYRVDQPTLKKLDILEDVENHLFKLKYLPDYQCYTYVKFDESVDELLKIDSGDWIAYINSLRVS